MNRFKIESRSNVIVVDAIRDGDLLGFAHVVPWRDGVFVCRLQVKIEHRRQRVGTEIMQRILTEHGDRPIYLHPAPFNGEPMDTNQLTDWYQRLGFEPCPLDVGTAPILRYQEPKRMDRSQLRRLLVEAMADPDHKAVTITYRSKQHVLTTRTISPIRFESAGTVLATCCGRGEPRQFTFDQIITAEKRAASDVLMPEGVAEVEGT
ncbi:GNAT family N-acetyltransferase [Rhodopirellula sp. SWK7]|uniref:GNAT family N-acetyltransferase n=1 Tax=Rhodopirellula sp. SWK7 TaxID=595460 RepID=UPI0002BFAF8D|nr:GNAT family N-acetyltransferase [Rhodopirellula sp. SWK7]EMI41691.1 GCN5-related N-acetyltransferase domain protein [Rhodopirellula sp. SWK7]